MIPYEAMRLIHKIFLALMILLLPTQVQAAGPAFVTIVNPIRGEEFWNLPHLKPSDAVMGQLQILNSKKATATYLLRFDALENEAIIQLLKNHPQHEKGLLLEITPHLTEAAQVSYRPSDQWYSSPNIFLTGYVLEDRFKIIDTVFGRFKSVFGQYPKSVGAWWIDASSLSYMQKKYGISASLMVADQYSTDSYQIWGQYWAAPYYPFLRNALIPAQNESDKIPVVMIQWAQRDPFNGYGKVVEDSTYSVQANDYLDYHNLDINYFAKLVDIYTKQNNPINQLTIGLENSFDWQIYSQEYEKQINLLSAKANKKEVEIVSMNEFANKYKALFPKLSPTMTFFAEDPLGTGSQVLWFMNPYFRAGLFFNQEGVWFRDIREYTGSEELCLKKPCDKINFASSFVASVDDVAFGTSWLVDEGEATNIKLASNDQTIMISYTNQIGRQRTIELLPRDISVDGVPLSISKIILNVKEGNFPSKQFLYSSSQEEPLLIQRLGEILMSPFIFLYNLVYQFFSSN